MTKLNETPLKLVVEVQFGTDIEGILEIIFAVARRRAENTSTLTNDYEYAEPPYWQYDYKRIGNSAYLIAADNFSVELMEIISELKKLLQIEVYFENHGNTGAAYLESDDYEEGYIENDALRRLVYEEAHDRHEKLSA